METGYGGVWGPVAPAVFKAVCVVPRVRQVGSTPIHLRQTAWDGVRTLG
jgi:hypothetical protein